MARMTGGEALVIEVLVGPMPRPLFVGACRPPEKYQRRGASPSR
jgi:hypothetical protein